MWQEGYLRSRRHGRLLTELTLELHLRQLIACRWISVPGTEGTWSGRKNATAQGDQGGARSYGVRGGRTGISVGSGEPRRDSQRRWKQSGGCLGTRVLGARGVWSRGV